MRFAKPSVICGGILSSLLAMNCAAQVPTPAFSTLYRFRGAPSDGSDPSSLVGKAGVLYGTTSSGGAAKAGTIFSVTPPATPGPWIEAVLYSLNGTTDGIGPMGLVQGADGTLYGCAQRGGSEGYGTAFSLTPPASPGSSWTFNLLYTFSFSSGEPFFGLVMGSSGILYGLTPYGGPEDKGTVYSLSPPASPGGAWTYSMLYAFPPDSASENPSALTIDGDGVLLGIAGQFGVVFALSPPASPGGEWKYSLLYEREDSILSLNGIVTGPGGVLYGTFIQSFIGGGVYSLTPPAAPGDRWTYATLYTFGAMPDGNRPQPLSVVGPGGVLYGVTLYGGGGSGSGDGTVFSLAPPSSAGGAWTETILHAFSGPDGANPAMVLLTSTGGLYGIAQSGVTGSGGSVFALR